MRGKLKRFREPGPPTRALYVLPKSSVEIRVGQRWEPKGKKNNSRVGLAIQKLILTEKASRELGWSGAGEPPEIPYVVAEKDDGSTRRLEFESLVVSYVPGGRPSIAGVEPFLLPPAPESAIDAELVPESEAPPSLRDLPEAPEGLADLLAAEALRAEVQGLDPNVDEMAERVEAALLRAWNREEGLRDAFLAFARKHPSVSADDAARLAGISPGTARAWKAWATRNGRSEEPEPTRRLAFVARRGESPEELVDEKAAE
jgi:hypothetical protein